MIKLNDKTAIKKIVLKNFALKNKFRTFRNTVKYNKQKKKKNIKKRKGKLISKSNKLPIRNKSLEQRFWEKENCVITWLSY